jgi:hypothetical protein
MRMRTLGRWASRLALAAALGVGVLVAGAPSGDVHDAAVADDASSVQLLDVSWN